MAQASRSDKTGCPEPPSLSEQSSHARPVPFRQNAAPAGMLQRSCRFRAIDSHGQSLVNSGNSISRIMMVASRVQSRTPQSRPGRGGPLVVRDDLTNTPTNSGCAPNNACFLRNLFCLPDGADHQGGRAGRHPTERPGRGGLQKTRQSDAERCMPRLAARQVWKNRAQQRRA